MTSVLLVLGLAWAKYGLNRLWVAHLRRTAGRDFDRLAEALELAPEAPGYGPRIRASGDRGGERLVLELRGGLSGELLRLRIGKRRAEVHLCELDEDPAAWARRALGGEAVDQ